MRWGGRSTAPGTSQGEWRPRIPLPVGALCRSLLAVGLAATLLIAGLASPATAAQAHQSPTATDESALGGGPKPAAPIAAQAGQASAPPDPENDTIGWENGIWANETLSIDAGDGLNESEFALVLARAMARTERLRQLEFRRTPNVRFVSRATYREYIDARFAAFNKTEADRLHQNTKFEALFLVGEDTSYFETARANQGAFAAAFYFSETPPNSTFQEGDLGIIVDEQGSIEFNEPVLGHELVHALQNQHFDLSAVRGNYGVKTEEDNIALLGLTEGDAQAVQSMYESRCGAEWDCVAARQQGSPPRFADLGLVVYQLAPYQEGPDLVEARLEAGGWEAVNALYENPPASTEQVIHPERYGSDPPTTVTVEDRSSEAWSIPNTSGKINYASFGEAGLYTMLWAPGTLREIPLAFTRNATAGWDGDRLVPYATADSSTTNETGYVWKIVWDSPGDADEFAAAYREKLASVGAREVPNADDAYVIPEARSREFGDAFALRVEGATTIIVNAPTVGALNEIRAGTVPENVRTPTPTPTVSPTPTPTTTGTPTAAEGGDATTTATDTPGTTTGTSMPGFGLVAVLLAMVALTAIVKHRER